VEETHYYPFGLTMAGISSKALAFGSPENKKEKFNGAELNTDFDLNQYEFQFRTYDPQIGRWHGLDTKPTDMVSLYAAMANNPIRYADPLGDTLALFRPDGTFWKFQDNGKKEWSGMVYQKSEVTSTYEKDGVTYEVRTYSEGKAFEFNDPSVDVQAIKNGTINRVEVMSDEKVEKQIDASGVKSPEAQAHPIRFANQSSRQGKMDYGVNGFNSGDLKANTFYIREKVAYNLGDIGNYLWGRGMAELGISINSAFTGAHINNMANGRRDNTPLYDFGPGTYGKPGLFDSHGDQRAISRGYSNSPKGAMLIKQTSYIESVKRHIVL
jgi:RHS repeat-associated protein